MVNQILIIVGMCGAGKSEAVRILEHKGFSHVVYFGQVVRDEVKRRGLVLNEVNERAVREELRKQHGMAAMAILSIDKIHDALTKGNVLVESLYSWEEYNVLREAFGDACTLVCIYTTKALRYMRLATRNERPLTHEEATSRDVSEIENLNKAGPIAYADVVITNDGTFEELKKALEILV